MVGDSPGTHVEMAWQAPIRVARKYPPSRQTGQRQDDHEVWTRLYCSNPVHGGRTRPARVLNKEPSAVTMR
jgi:hypothetical protein